MVTEVVDYPELVQTDDTKSFRIRVSPVLKDRYGEMCGARKISEQDAGNALLAWIVEQEPEVQAMILGQLPANDDLVETVLRRMQKPRRKARSYTDLRSSPKEAQQERR